MGRKSEIVARTIPFLILPITLDKTWFPQKYFIKEPLTEAIYRRMRGHIYPRCLQGQGRGQWPTADLSMDYSAKEDTRTNTRAVETVIF